VGSETSASDVSRFDSGAFNFTESLADEILSDTAALPDLVPYSRIPSTSDAVSKAAIKRAAEPPTSLSETADLLESLRRRRGEREAANLSDAAKTAALAQARRAGDASGAGPAATSSDTTPAPASPGEPARSIWANQGGTSQGATTQSGKSTGRGTTSGAKRGRAAMPSWDEIVFGARTDDDLA